MPQAVPLDALAAFDSLPDSAQVDARTVAALHGCTVPTVWRRAARGDLPKPRKFGASARWNVGELRQTMAAAPYSELGKVTPKKVPVSVMATNVRVIA